MSACPVTVIISCKGEASDLTRALDSVLQQTLPPAEVVVVDCDAGEDVETIAEKSGARCLRLDGGGEAAAFNLGLREASTEFVAFLAARNWYEPGKLERSYGRLRELGASCLATDAWLIDGDRIARGMSRGRPVPGVLTQELLIVDNPVARSTVVCNREAVIDAGGFDEDPSVEVVEGYDLWLRMARREPVAYLGEPLSFCRASIADPDRCERVVPAVDQVLGRVIARNVAEPHFAQLAARRRASVRLDVARNLLGRGESAKARRWIAEARRIAPMWRGHKLWLMTLLPGALA